MKFTAAVFTALSIAGASAFVPGASKSHSTALYSTIPPRRELGSSDFARSTSPQSTAAAGSFSSAPSSGVRAGGLSPVSADRSDIEAIDGAWDDQENETTVQGDSLRTWSYPSIMVERVQVLLKTDGRPLNADVELWQGPDNCPQKMAVYLEDGAQRPFRAMIESPRGSNTIAIRNTAQMEFPLTAGVEPDIKNGKSPALSKFHQKILENPGRVIQGGAIVTYPFDPMVQKVSVCLKTDGRPLNARVELLQGPNNNKEVVEVYCEDGFDRPFMMVVDTPGVGNVVRVVNTATVEFPLNAAVEPIVIDDGMGDAYSGPSTTGGPGGKGRGPGQDKFFFEKP